LHLEIILNSQFLILNFSLLFLSHAPERFFVRFLVYEAAGFGFSFCPAFVSGIPNLIALSH